MICFKDIIKPAPGNPDPGPVTVYPGFSVIIPLLKFLLILTPVVVISCYYDNEENLYPSVNTGCDTLNVTYTDDIVPLLSTYCYACHSELNAPAFGNNLSLEAYGDVAANATRVSGAINHDPDYTSMPAGGLKLNECLIMKFDAWVNQGSNNN